MPAARRFGIQIDKLTRSIENALTGDRFKTEVIRITDKDLRLLKRADWNFDWRSEVKKGGRAVYKLVIVDNPDIIQGLVSIEEKAGHIFMHLIESSKYNRGKSKVYIGVRVILWQPPVSWHLSWVYEGFVSFESKTKLMEHYQATLGARILYHNTMVIETPAAAKLVAQYFPDICNFKT